MDAATLSLGALAVAIVVSCTIRLHVGFLAISLAWVVGVYIADMSAAEVMSGFPTRLFLTLAGVTLLFSQAQANGTLDLIAHKAVLLCRGNVGVMPMMFFALSFVLASIGPGNIASVALMAPMGMAVAGAGRHPRVPDGDHDRQRRQRRLALPHRPYGGHRQRRDGRDRPERLRAVHLPQQHDGARRRRLRRLLPARRLAAAGALPRGRARRPGAGRRRRRRGRRPRADDFQREHWITIGVIAALLVGVILFNVDVGLGAFGCAIVLALLKAGDESEAVKIMPWRVIMMVCGVTVLISVLDETGGLELFTRVLAGVSTANTVTAVMAFTTGFISIYSSTSGVVLPAFLPTVPGLAAQVGGVEPLAIASSMNVGAHLVDVSALSTLGALCMAAAPKSEDPRKLFNKLMAWGLSMTIVGGFTCWLLFTVLRIGIG